MEKCARLLFDSNGNPIKLIGEIPCDQASILSGLSWEVLAVVCVAAFIIAIILWFTIGYPRWNVWASKKAGEADLEQAHKEQAIQVARAQARFNAAELNKKAAIVEAEAISEQIEKIGEKLTSHDLFLKWQWIKMMEEKPEGSVIYVPTEANLPILEAGKRSEK